MTPTIRFPSPAATARIRVDVRQLAIAAGALLLAVSAAAPSRAASLVQRVDVDATPAEVWGLIGPYCAIADWLPPIGSCLNDGKTPATRTLVTKENAATFVERETERSDTEYFYSYAFVSSPLPVRNYRSTIRVMPRGTGGATVVWTGVYEPELGQDKQALEALTGVYKAGLASIASRFAH